MQILLKYIKYKNIVNEKNISRSFERRLLKTFDFEDNDTNISGVLNFIWKKKIYELLICVIDNDKVNSLIYKTFSSKEEAYTFYEEIYNLLLKSYGEN